MAFRCIRNKSSPAHLPQPVVATLGSFDGLHQGHQALARRVAQKTKDLAAAQSTTGTAVLISFYPHPALVLGKIPEIKLLTTLHQEARILEECGIDVLYLVHFTSLLSKLSASEFIDQELIGKLGVRHLIIGPDAHIGRARDGTPETIKKLMTERGLGVEVVETVLSGDGVRVSSGAIRTAVQTGNLETARTYLGRPYAVEGRVIRGAGRGRTIGVPTANILIRDQLLPPAGVYATRAVFGNRILHSVTNLGVRPTFGSSALSLECHILDSEVPDLYDSRLEVQFVQKLREEIKFNSPQELVSRIQADIVAAQQILSK